MSEESSAYIYEIGGDVKGIVGDVKGGVVNFIIAQKSEAEIRNRTLIKGSPYMGLNKFEPGDKDKFFGREQWIIKLTSHLEDNNLLFLLGASGSGKSSLVQAGLIPHLSDQWGAARVVRLIFVPDKNPFESLYESLPRKYKDEAAEIIDEKEPGTLIKLVKNLKEDSHQWFVFIDQFEELFTITPKLERDKFIASLVQLIKQQDNSVKLIMAMRSDFIDNLRDYADLTNEVESKFRLVRELTEIELRLAIAEPAARNGVTFEKGLVEQILHDFNQQAGSLPLLQYTLDLLWREDKPSENNRVLNIATYQAIGGVSGALQQQANYIYNKKLNNKEKKAAEKIFIELIDIAAKEPVSRRVEPSQFRNDPVRESTLNKLIEYRLLVSGRYKSTVEVAHEELLRCWGFIQNLIREQEEIIILRSRLIGDANQWYELRKEDEEKAQDELWSGSKLERVLELIDEKAFGSLDEKSEQFIQASVERRDRQKRKKEEQRQRELEQERKARKAAQKTTVITLIAAPMLTLLLIVAGITWRAKQIEEIRNLSESSKALLVSNQDLEALTGILKVGKTLESSIWQAVWPEPNLRTQVTETLHRVVYRVKERNRLSGHLERVFEVFFSPNGKLLATTEFESDTVRFWDLEGKQVTTFQEHQGLIKNASFSSDGKFLATADENGIARLWNLEGKQVVRLEGSVRRVIFSPDSKLLATIRWNNSVGLWDMDGNQSAVLRGHNDYVSSVIFSPDSKLLATIGFRGSIHLWDLDGNPVTEFRVDQRELNDSQVAFSSDGQLLAVAENYVNGLNSRVTLRDLNGNQVVEFKGHTGSVHNVTFSPDGKFLATASHDRTARLWDLQGNQEAVLRGHEHSVRRVVFSPNGQQIATASWDGTARLWDLKGKQVAEFRGHQGIIDDVSFSPDGKLLATSGDDRTARLWDLEGQQVARFHQHSSSVDVDFSPNGELLAVAGHEISTGNQTISLWNWSGRKLEELINHGTSGVSSLYDVAFSSNGQLIATAEEGGIARIWNPEGKQLLDLKADRNRLLKVRFSPDSQLLATAGIEGIPRLWNLEGKQIAKFKADIRLIRFSFSPDNQLLATAGEDGSVYLWDLEGNLKTNFKCHQGTIRDISFSPDGQQLATAGEYRLARLWDLNCNQLAEFKGHQDSISDLSFSPNGQYLATAGDRTARLWDLSGNQLAEFSNERADGYRADMDGVSFSPDGQQLITVGGDGTIERWRIKGFYELMVHGCDWVSDYLKNNLDVEEGDRHLCDGIGTKK